MSLKNKRESASRSRQTLYIHIAFPCFVLCSFPWKDACSESFWCHICHVIFQVCSSKAYFEFLDLRWKSTILKIHLREVGVQENCFSLFNSLADVRTDYVFLSKMSSVSISCIVLFGKRLTHS